MKTKIVLVEEFFKKADNIRCCNTGVIYSFRKNSNTEYVFESCDRAYVDIVITDIDLQNAECHTDSIKIKDYTFECQTVQIIPPPFELLPFHAQECILEEIADECEGRVYEGYSGRCMYGKECWGITTSNTDRAIAAASKRGINNSRQDSMGLQSIVYWPHLTYTRQDEPESDNK